MPAYNTFKVLQPELKDTFAPKKLKKPKLPKVPAVKGLKMPKIIVPGGGSY